MLGQYVLIILYWFPGWAPMVIGQTNYTWAQCIAEVRQMEEYGHYDDYFAGAFCMDAKLARQRVIIPIREAYP